jgi:hypothetical protein
VTRAFGRMDTAAAVVGFATAGLLIAAIVAGSTRLRHYDLALLPYTVGVVLAAFTVAYRYTVWLQRPPTRLFWRRGWRLLLRGDQLGANALFLARSAAENLFAQRFIARRGAGRWIAHFCIAWGCSVAAAITFPLVFGWLHFETRPDGPHWYRMVALGHTVAEFHTQSLARYVVFNLLNISAVMVIVGAVLALRRRLSDAGAAARQQFGNDIVPLLLLIAISATGLMLSVSAHLLAGYGYPAISLIHALVVTGTLLYMPFGKLFHVLQRPAQVGVALYRRANEKSPAAACRSCARPFASSVHVADLVTVLAEVGADGSRADICPRCRRRLLGHAHGRLLGRGL